MSNEELLKKATDSIDDLFGDQSVSKERAIENLEELQAQIEGMINVLEEELSTEDV